MAAKQEGSLGGGWPLENLAPAAFFDEWPDGELTPPAEFDAFPFADDVERQAWLRAVELFRDLVLDYRYFVATKTRQAVANATGLSTNTLSNFNGGKNFPRLGTYLVLRAALPETTKELREAAEARQRRKAMADERWVEKQTQERLALEVERRVEARTRGRQPRRPGR